MGASLGQLGAFQLLTYQLLTVEPLLEVDESQNMRNLFSAKVRVTSDSSEAISAAPGWVFKESFFAAIKLVVFAFRRILLVKTIIKNNNVLESWRTYQAW